MSEYVQEILHNLIIVGSILAVLIIWAKWKHKQMNEDMLKGMEQSYLKYAADPKSQAKYQKARADYYRKHPVKNIKRILKEKLGWLF